jgi:hypothetical protein
VKGILDDEEDTELECRHLDLRRLGSVVFTLVRPSDEQLPALHSRAASAPR